MWILVLLGTEVVFGRVFFSKFCKSFSVELPFVFFVLKEKDKKKVKEVFLNLLFCHMLINPCHFAALSCHLFDVAS